MKHSNFLRLAAAIALPLATISTIILAIQYVQEQQMLRQLANEPQVQLAESIASQVAAGVPPQAFLQGGATAIETVQTPYILFADETGKIIGGNASLAGALPTLPSGVVGAHKGVGPMGENRITWQPTATVRQALVIAPFTTPQGQKGYVIVGRSLRETEAEASQHLMRAAFGWLATMIAVIAVSLLSAWLLKRRKD